MKPRLALLALLLTLLVAGASAQGGAPSPLGELTIADSPYAKLPRVAALGGQVFVAANTGRSRAALFARPVAADAFGPAESLGPAEGHPDYSTASAAAARDGRLVYAWINQPQRTIYARVRAPGSAWGPARTVYAGSPFPVYVAVAATGRAIVVAWRDPDRPVVFSRSDDDGASWSAPARISERAGVGAPALAAGPGGEIAVAYAQAEGGRLQVFAGLWNGRAFDVRRISSSAGDFADPGVAVLPDGRVVVAYRGVDESGGAAGVFYAERAPDGAWPVARLVGGKVMGPVSAAGDEAGGLSLFWVGAAQGRSRVWYARRDAAGAWSPPAGAAAAGDDATFNVSGAVAAAPDGALYAHAASERFVGDRTFVRAYRFLAGRAAAAVAARPVIEGGAASSRAASLRVAFADVVGAPAELRWRWDAPPSEADPWQPFAAVVDVAPPAGDACGERALYTQVRAGAAQGAPASDSIALDRHVQASIAHLAAGSAPGSSALPFADLAVDAAADCSGLSSARIVGGPEAPLAGPTALLRADLLAATAEEGPRELAVELADGLGNTRLLTTTVVYDRTPPAVAIAGPLAVSPDPDATIFQTLRVDGLAFADNYSAAPWGLEVAVVAPGGAAAVAVVPIPQRGLRRDAAGAYAVDAELNLAQAFSRSDLAPGSYRLTLRVLDAAGNAGAAAAELTLALDAVTYPRAALPLLRR